MGTPAGIESHERDYRAGAWCEYELSELGMWVHLLVKRSALRQDPTKRARDLYDAQNYLDMMQAKPRLCKRQCRVRLMVECLIILALAFAQNVSFSVVSRSRNRNNMTYHLIAAVFSNGVWFLTFRQLVLRDMDAMLFIPYTIGTVSGSLLGVKISMGIERLIGAASDSHLVK